MIITISSNDIQLIRQNLKANPHKSAFVLGSKESLLITHDDQKIMLPFRTDIAIPSEADIDTCLVNNNKNWIVINKDGVWIYAVASNIDINLAMINSVKSIVATSAEDYISKMSSLVRILKNWVGITVQLYPFEHINSITLQMDEPFICTLSSWLSTQSSG